MSALIFLDTETTGLDVGRHEVWEIAFARETGPVRSFILPHSLQTADPKALDINTYWERFPLGAVHDGTHLDIAICEELSGATIVGSNPRFDCNMLRARWGVEPWHHRLVNVAEGAMWLFGWDRPKGLNDVILEPVARGYEIPVPDHTAARDVEVTRAAYLALREIRAALA